MDRHIRSKMPGTFKLDSVGWGREREGDVWTIDMEENVLDYSVRNARASTRQE
jgi:hypothetical protein